MYSDDGFQVTVKYNALKTHFIIASYMAIEDCDPLIIKKKNNNKHKMKIICFMIIILSCISFSLNRSIFNQKQKKDIKIELEQKNQVLMAGALAVEKLYNALKTHFIIASYMAIEECDPLIIKKKNSNKNKMKIIWFMIIILSCISFSLNRSIFNQKQKKDIKIELDQKNQALMAGALAVEKLYNALKTHFIIASYMAIEDCDPLIFKKKNNNKNKMKIIWFMIIILSCISFSLNRSIFNQKQKKDIKIELEQKNQVLMAGALAVEKLYNALKTHFIIASYMAIEDCDPLIIKKKNSNKNKMKIICFMIIILSCISLSLNRSIFNQKQKKDIKIELEQKNQVLMAGALAVEKLYNALKTHFIIASYMAIEDCDPLIIKKKNSNKNKMKIICFMIIILSCISLSLNRSIFNQKQQKDTKIELDEINRAVMAGALAAEKIYNSLKTHFKPDNPTNSENSPVKCKKIKSSYNMNNKTKTNSKIVKTDTYPCSIVK
ncbi:uncharacterized protein LOC126551489 isoform X3 [Aphis gossypii]|uniref:uncharacterized protein LOC126551489 isoform X3 n=1 Tax=Aphis gossypii TaxID=80765 RepID=UPI0021597771|nr:uncharacterized protein LOC126551489 isoform X3 [Aphis gossypii]